VILGKRKCSLTYTFVQHIHVFISLLLCSLFVCFQFDCLCDQLLVTCIHLYCVHLFVCFQFNYLCDQLLITVFICVCGHFFCLFSVTYYLYVLIHFNHQRGWICVRSQLELIVGKFEHGE
jgi:hypothetical protein